MQALGASAWHGLSQQLTENEPSLVILSANRDRNDELELLTRIRRVSDVPVIIANHHGCDEIDRAIALEHGADDYLTCPFGLRELLARVRAVLRRDKDSSRARCARRPRELVGFRFGGWKLSLRDRRLTDPHGAPVALSKGEYALLVAFLEAPQRPLRREYLARATRVHGDVFDRSIDVQTMRLRRKLETDPSTPRVIKTERGVGYVFTLPVEKLITHRQLDLKVA
jgi:DNA-binding response OmpR family regulator